jgi:hypothetical protein
MFPINNYTAQFIVTFYLNAMALSFFFPMTYKNEHCLIFKIAL